MCPVSYYLFRLFCLVVGGFFLGGVGDPKPLTVLLFKCHWDNLTVMWSLFPFLFGPFWLSFCKLFGLFSFVELFLLPFLLGFLFGFCLGFLIQMFVFFHWFCFSCCLGLGFFFYVFFFRLIFVSCLFFTLFAWCLGLLLSSYHLVLVGSLFCFAIFFCLGFEVDDLLVA